MRRAPLVAVLPLLALALAGCTGGGPFQSYPTSSLPEVRAVFDLDTYDSDGNNRTDGVAVTLRSVQPGPGLVGSDLIVNRNGDDNVTFWRCPQREALLCDRNEKAPLSWEQGETQYIRGLPGVNRLNFAVKERFVYNTTLRIDETRDTEVWAILSARAYDSNGNRTLDGIEINLLDSDKSPFPAGELRVVLNKVEVPVFREPLRRQELTGQWGEGTKIFVDGFIGENRVELFLRSTLYDLGGFLVGE